MVHGDTRSGRDWVANTQSSSAVALVLACVVAEGAPVAPTVKLRSGFVPIGVRAYD